MGVYSGDGSLTSEEREELRDTLLEARGPAYVPWLVRESKKVALELHGGSENA
jgi:hypothetical protein